MHSAKSFSTSKVPTSGVVSKSRYSITFPRYLPRRLIYVQSFNSDAITWGALGKQLYKPGGRYAVSPSCLAAEWPDRSLLSPLLDCPVLNPHRSRRSRSILADSPEVPEDPCRQGRHPYPLLGPRLFECRDQLIRIYDFHARRVLAVLFASLPPALVP